MNKLKLKGKLLKYSALTNELIIKLDMMDPSLHANLEYILSNFDKYLELQVAYNHKESIMDSLRRKWYVSLRNILLKNDIYPNSENMEKIDNEFRESLFPVKEVEPGIFEPRRMKEMTDEELKKSIELLLQRHPEAEG